jgi:hypothetical protein
MMISEGEKLIFKISIGVFFLIIFCVVVVHVDAYGAGNDAEKKLHLAEEIKNLQAADAAWRRNDTKFRELRNQDQAAKSEIREFAVFVAELKRKVIEGCEAVRMLGGDANQHCADCVKLENEPESKKGGVLPNAKREPTREEKAVVLTSRLKKIESDFDGMIIIQQAKIRGEQSVSQSNGGGTSGFDDTSEANETAGGGVLTDGAVEESRSKPEPIEWEAEPGAGPGVEKQGKMPDFKIEDIGDGSDDDVVARQLREAAESETDQVLKEQLWNEYKKYKKSMR